MEIREAKDFLQQDIETVCQLLSAEELKISTEVEILRTALGWLISNNNTGRYDKVYKLLCCIRFHQMSQKELMECHHIVKAVDDVVLLYAYCSIVPKLMAEHLQDGINVSSTEPRICSSRQSELAPLLNFLSNQEDAEDASSDISEFEDVSDIEEEAKVQSKKDTLRRSMERLDEKMRLTGHWSKTKEFEEVASKREDLTMDAARRSFNFYKNRDKENLPYDDNRVQVLDNCFTDYINASYIKMDIKGSKNEVRNYIAAQDPLKKTTHSFWIMVWQQEVERILALTSEIECKETKSKRYWPFLGKTKTYGKIQVTCTAEVKLSYNLVERKFKMKNLTTQEERIITQNQYEGWAELGGPDDTKDFLKFLGMVRRETEGSQNPIVVHCSSGVGRVGVLISLDTAWSLMEERQPVYPLEIIKELREQRANCVENVHEYKFICKAILKVYKKKLYKRKSRAEKRQSPWRRMFNGLRKTLCSCFGGGKEVIQDHSKLTSDANSSSSPEQLQNLEHRVTERVQVLENTVHSMQRELQATVTHLTSYTNKVSDLTAMVDGIKRYIAVKEKENLKSEVHIGYVKRTTQNTNTNEETGQVENHTKTTGSELDVNIQCTQFTDSSMTENQPMPIQTRISKPSDIFRGVVRKKVRKIVLYNVEADQPYELVEDAVRTYARNYGVNISFVRLLRKVERRSYNTFTMKLNMNQSDYNTICDNDTFWPEGVYWRDWDPEFKKHRYEDNSYSHTENDGWGNVEQY